MALFLPIGYSKTENPALSVLAPEASAKRMNEWSSISILSICDKSYTNHIIICISIFAGHYTTCCKKTCLALLKMGKSLPETC